MDNERVTLHLLLDLSAAFDTVDYGTLLRRLKNSFGIQVKVLSWFQPQAYLSGRSHCISAHSALSRRFNLECGVPPGPCLGTLLFTPYTCPVDCRLFRIVYMLLVILLHGFQEKWSQYNTRNINSPLI